MRIEIKYIFKIMKNREYSMENFNQKYLKRKYM